jgi:hypothetical protein
MRRNDAGLPTFCPAIGTTGIVQVAVDRAFCIGARVTAPERGAPDRRLWSPGFVNGSSAKGRPRREALQHASVAFRDRTLDRAERFPVARYSGHLSG